MGKAMIPMAIETASVIAMKNSKDRVWNRYISCDDARHQSSE
jgi:hypothetical protein